MPIILSGGLAHAKNFDKVFEQELNGIDLPFEISDIRVAAKPNLVVARGCLLAAQL